MIEAKEITKKETFEAFNLSAKNQLFLQSWNYGELCKGLSEKVFRLGVYEENRLVGIAQIIVVEAKRGSHFFCPYGPVFNEWKSEYFSTFIDYLKKRGENESIAFVRVSPFIKNTIKNDTLFKDQGAVDAPMHALAETTWLVDLTQSEEEIMEGMRKTNRNLIRRAVKEGVVVEKSTDDSAVEEFIALHKQTKLKHDFTPYPDSFFREQVKQFRRESEVLVYNARYQDTVISSAIIMYYGKMAAYHHGANSLEHQKIPSSYLIQWEAMQEAKKRGCTVYNFWGVSPDKDRPHPISGVSHFKRGFGGYQYDLLHAQDFPLGIKYRLNWIVETMRRRKRGYYFKKPE
ncbi:peptidoglycan bridge formation glycyltransferase FemA/FemB family protein [Patescibacteria group bacterium]|nr:peptidoglycan bridge formation glycyltransferase FemA/FemB family protein [Patescibacteria group bacterium]